MIALQQRSSGLDGLGQQIRCPITLVCQEPVILLRPKPWTRNPGGQDDYDSILYHSFELGPALSYRDGRGP